MKKLTKLGSVRPYSGALLGLIAALSALACGGGDGGNEDGASQEGGDGDSGDGDSGDGDSGDGTDPLSTGGSGSDGGNPPLDRCSDPQPESACADGWICDRAQWVCRDLTDGTGGSGGSTDGTGGNGGSTDGTGGSGGSTDGTGGSGGSTDPTTNPDPEVGPDDFEGQPCTEGPYLQFDCATCFCTDAGVYQCAYIFDCGEDPYPPADSCNTPAPNEPCDTASGTWICYQGLWMCNELTW